MWPPVVCHGNKLNVMALWPKLRWTEYEQKCKCMLMCIICSVVQTTIRLLSSSSISKGIQISFDWIQFQFHKMALVRNKFPNIFFFYFWFWMKNSIFTITITHTNGELDRWNPSLRNHFIDIVAIAIRTRRPLPIISTRYVSPSPLNFDRCCMSSSI